MSSRMDMAIYQAISQKPIHYPSKVPDLVKDVTVVHPIMPMDRIMALIEAGVDPSFKRRTGEDAMLAALINKRIDIVEVLHSQYGVSISPSTVRRWFQCCHPDDDNIQQVDKLDKLKRENAMLKSEILRIKKISVVRPTPVDPRTDMLE